MLTKPMAIGRSALKRLQIRAMAVARRVESAERHGRRRYRAAPPNPLSYLESQPQA